MIWTWLAQFALFALRALLPLSWLPEEPREPQIDRNAKCVVCGARDGALLAMRPAGEVTPGGLPTSSVLCQHTCNICGARWYEKPVYIGENKDDIIHPADQQYIRHQFSQENLM
jgi:hypothetical protein